jgi:hypothetical protein
VTLPAIAVDLLPIGLAILLDDPLGSRGSLTAAKGGGWLSQGRLRIRRPSRDSALSSQPRGIAGLRQTSLSCPICGIPSPGSPDPASASVRCGADPPSSCPADPNRLSPPFPFRRTRAPPDAGRSSQRPVLTLERMRFGAGPPLSFSSGVLEQGHPFRVQPLDVQPKRRLDLPHKGVLVARVPFGVAGSSGLSVAGPIQVIVSRRASTAPTIAVESLPPLMPDGGAPLGHPLPGGVSDQLRQDLTGLLTRPLQTTHCGPRGTSSDAVAQFLPASTPESSRRGVRLSPCQGLPEPSPW